MGRVALSSLLPLFAAILAACPGHAAGADDPPRAAALKDDGYRGIWYANQPTGDQYRYKYSGGFATYPQQHIPIAIYSKEARKTFFCYGGRPRDENRLLIMVSYYDHATGTVPRPAILLDKRTDDAHDNPTLSLDDEGYLWVFANAHGTSRPAYIHRSTRPHSIDEFERIATTNFSYAQPWHLPGRGFLVLHTRYSPGRNLFWMTSADGRTWAEPRPLARVALGHYQISRGQGDRLATAFNYHPRPLGLNARTNLYYLETPDGGRTWRTADGTAARTPMTEPQNPALVHDYEAEGRLVYLKDLQFDAEGRPVILYLTSRGYEPGPANGPRTWYTARWTGSDWKIRPFTGSDHNYDFGSLYIEPDGTWRIIAPTEPGPQPFGTGGEMVMWASRDQGATWQRVKQLTHDSRRNHTYARRPLDAHPDFYAFWADGDVLRPSGSNLYFTNQTGDHVWRLPETMTGESARPEVAW
ncbi:MAG: BNR-4 repeat-containing protein [Isosphaeraceae bacterium]|nr:BNR-4 repeat-containing protein [Isosphaeraceae bacterium]